MSAVMRDLFRTALARSLYVAAAFIAALVLVGVAGQAPERSVGDWFLLASVLIGLALVAGLLAAWVDLGQR
jgi:protein-S-isoprenylcysteine O-methyltransferase Ste14